MSAWKRPRAPFAAALVLILAAAFGALVLPSDDRPARAQAPTPPAAAASTPTTLAPGVTVRRAAPPARRMRARRSLARSLGSRAVVQTDPITGGVRKLVKLNGTLAAAPAAASASTRGAPAARVLDYVREHEAAFGLDAGDLDGLHLVERERVHGLTHLRWQQRVGGIPLVEGGVRAVLTAEGELASVGGGARADLTEEAETVPQVTASQARRTAAAATGTAGAEPAVQQATTAGTRRTVFANGDEASLVHTLVTGEVRLAWRVVRQDGSSLWDQFVDARTGKELRRVDRMSHAAATVFDHHPGAAAGGANRTVDLAPDLPAGATELAGDGARVFADLNDNDAADAAETIRPKPDGTYTYPRTAFTGTGCLPGGCAWNRSSTRSWQVNTNQSGTQLFHFLRTFRRHLASAPIAFDEFSGDDRIDAQVLDGADVAGGMPDRGHLNNAGMGTRPEGQSPVMQMYLFHNFLGRTTPARNASDDASVVYHEYTHGLVSRLVKDATGWGAMDLRQSAAMGEGFADFYAMDYLVAENLAPDAAAHGDVEPAPHLVPDGFRTQGLDCPVGSTEAGCQGTPTAGAGGYTYGDFGKVGKGPEEHDDGEIWAETLWDLRRALIAQHGAAEGVRRTRMLLTTALRVAPLQPSFLDMRNAILEADLLYRAGDRARIWTVFADRGMGWGASTVDGDDAAPVEDPLGPPSQTSGAITGQVTDASTGRPVVGAEVALGGHDSGAGFPDQLSAVTDAQGSYRLTGAGRGVFAHLMVTKPGYEPQVLEDVVVGGDDVLRNAQLRRNWADARTGATITSSTADNSSFKGCGPKALIDGDRTSGWVSVGQTHVLEVELPADVRLTSIALDPTPRCEQGDDAMPGRIEVQAAPATGSQWSTVAALDPQPGNMRQVSELRPPAPLDEVRRVRMVVRAPAATTQISMSELMVFASPRTPPRAAFGWTGAPRIGEKVTFDASTSTAGSSPLVRHEWDLDGDGSYETDTGATATVERAFDEAGRRTVGLRVRNAEGEVDEVRRAVEIGTAVEIFDLGTLEPDDAGRARAVGIDRTGRVLGQTNPTGGTSRKAFLYRGGAAEELPALPGHTSAGAAEEGPRDFVVGQSAQTNLTVPRAVAWTNGQVEDLGTFGGTGAVAWGTNAAGIVVGGAMNTRGDVRPFIKTPGAPLRDIEELAGIPTSQRRTGHARKIGSGGQVVGCYGTNFTDCDGDAFRYDHATTTLTKLPDLGAVGSAADVDTAGNVVGWVQDLDGTQWPAHWSSAGVLTKLPRLASANAAAIALNDAGTVVGQARDALGRLRAVRWTNGQLQDLTDMVKGTGWELQSAQAINARGEIVGWGVKDGLERAFQLSFDCRVCFEDVVVEERDVPSGTWQPVGDDGTVDGNRVRLRVKLHNEDDQPHLVQLKGTDTNRDEPLAGSGEPVSLDPGENSEVTVEYDTEGRAWDAEGKPDADHLLRLRVTLGKTVFATRTEALKVRPKPLVLVHGMASDASTWAPYADFARRAHPDWVTLAVDGMDTGSWARPLTAPNTVAQNAKVMAAEVARLRGAEDAERVDVVAHSMGGLITRRYIQSEMPPIAEGSQTPVIDRLIQLGTPNQGSPCAELTGLDMQYELRRDVAARFNAEVTERRGVDFSVLVGDWAPFTCSSSEDGDTVVALSSAKWEIEDAVVHSILHTDMTGSGAVFTSFVRPRLDGTIAPGEPQPEAAGMRALTAKAEPEASAGRSHELLARRVVSLPGGGTAQTELQVDGGSTLVAHVLAAPGTGAELVAPGGQVAASVPAGSKGSRSPLRSLRAATPAKGTWRVRLIAPQGAETTQAQVTGQLVDDRWSLALRTGRAAEGGGTPLVATLTRSARRVPGGTVSVTARRRGGEPVEVTLHDDGAHGDGGADDGCYGGAAQLAAGETLLTAAARTPAGTQRVRETLADVAAPSGAGEPAVCPGDYGRNGEIAFRAETPKHQPLGWRAVDQVGAETSLPGLPAGAAVVYSPDGERVAFTRLGDVHVANADGSDDQIVLDDDAQRHRRDVAWSADGTKLAYEVTCPRQSYSCHVGVLDLAAPGTERFVAEDEGLTPEDPAWSPDGRWIVVSGVSPDGCGGVQCPARRDLYKVRATGADPAVRITTGGHGDELPEWSPDGDRIAFVRWDTVDRESPVGNDSEIYTVDHDGSELENLTDDPDCQGGDCRTDDADTAPVWSPDGRQIAWTSTQGEPNDAQQRIPLTDQVWTMRRDGTGQAKLTTTPTAKLTPTWRALPYLATQEPPQCRALTVVVTQDVPAEVPLDCADANGDELTLEVVERPTHGTLSAVTAGGTVTYTPATGYMGADTLTYRASDGAAQSNVARIAIDVIAPPPPPPPPPPVEEEHQPGWGGPIGGGRGGSGGSGSSGNGNGNGNGNKGPGRSPLPPNCDYNPVTQSCMVGVPCAPGGDISNCTGRFAEAPGGRRAFAAAAAAGRGKGKTAAGRLLRPVVVTVPAGQTRQVALRLTARGQALLKRRGKVSVRIRFTLTAGGKTLTNQTRTVVFRVKKRSTKKAAARRP